MHYKLFGFFILMLALTQNLILSILLTGGVFFLVFNPDKKKKSTKIKIG